MHATFFDSRPDGSYALPPTAQTVAQSVAPPMEQTVAYQRPGMVGTVGAGELPLNPSVHNRPLVHPHIRYVGALAPHDEQSPSMCVFPCQQAEKSRQNRHVMS